MISTIDPELAPPWQATCGIGDGDSSGLGLVFGGAGDGLAATELGEASAVGTVAA